MRVAEVRWCRMHHFWIVIDAPRHRARRCLVLFNLISRMLLFDEVTNEDDHDDEYDWDSNELDNKTSNAHFAPNKSWATNNDMEWKWEGRGFKVGNSIGFVNLNSLDGSTSFLSTVVWLLRDIYYLREPSLHTPSGNLSHIDSRTKNSIVYEP